MNRMGLLDGGWDRHGGDAIGSRPPVPRRQVGRHIRYDGRTTTSSEPGAHGIPHPHGWEAGTWLWRRVPKACFAYPGNAGRGWARRTQMEGSMEGLVLPCSVRMPRVLSIRMQAGRWMEGGGDPNGRSVGKCRIASRPSSHGPRSPPTSPPAPKLRATANTTRSPDYCTPACLHTLAPDSTTRPQRDACIRWLPLPAPSAPERKRGFSSSTPSSYTVRARVQYAGSPPLTTATGAHAPTATHNPLPWASERRRTHRLCGKPPDTKFGS